MTSQDGLGAPDAFGATLPAKLRVRHKDVATGAATGKAHGLLAEDNLQEPWRRDILAIGKGHTPAREDL